MGKDFTSDEKMEEMLSNMGSYMLSKLNERIEAIKKRLEEVDKSENKNKDELKKKLAELIQVMENIFEKTKLQTQIQKDLIELTDRVAKLDEEIDKLLLC